MTNNLAKHTTTTHTGFWCQSAASIYFHSKKDALLPLVFSRNLSALPRPILQLVQRYCKQNPPGSTKNRTIFFVFVHPPPILPSEPFQPIFFLLFNSPHHLRPDNVGDGTRFVYRGLLKQKTAGHVCTLQPSPAFGRKSSERFRCSRHPQDFSPSSSLNLPFVSSQISTYPKMTTQSLDLVYELQLELGWTPDFAATAQSEYMRWLRLRAQSGDYQYCKLPPSRVVGTVWALHRQWTQDYETTCSNLGGFIHHFPPVMRMNLAREEAYSATLHTYKSIYKEDPPESHWGRALCTYNPLSSNGDASLGLNPQQSPPRALPSLRRSPAKRDSSMLKAPTTPTKTKRAAAETSRRISAAMNTTTAVGADKPRTSSDATRQRRNSKSTKVNKNAAAEVEDEAFLDDDDELMKSPGRPRKRFSGPSPLYILRPLVPGEKRKRGRPSFSDYVLATDVNHASATGDTKKKDAKTPADKATTSKAGGLAHALRRRKSIASPSKTPSAAPTIVKKEKGHKPFRRVARSSASSTITDPNKTASTVPAANQTQPGQQAKDGAGPVKRPRGRPRKDGSWPVARARKTEAASKPAAPVAQKPATALNAADKPKGAEGDGPKAVMPKGSDVAMEASNVLSALAPAAHPAQTTSELPSVPSGSVPAPLSSTMLPIPTSGATLPVVSNGTTLPIPANVSQPVPPSAAAPMLAPMDAGMQPKQLNPVENVLGQGALDNAIPSKIIDSRDLQMQDLADKEVSKPQGVHEDMPRDGVFEQIMDGSGLVEKDRPVDMSNALSGRDVRMGHDVVFPQSETMRDPSEMDMSLSGPSRPENVPNLSGTPVEMMSHGHQGGEKLMHQANTFSMNPMNVPSVSNPLDTGMLPMGASAVHTRPDVEGDKDGDLQIEDGDPKKPFKRPRGRPRKDGTWPVPRAKPMNEDAVERVKDISDPALNFPVGPSGTV